MVDLWLLQGKFSPNRPLGHFGLVVAMSVCLCVFIFSHKEIAGYGPPMGQSSDGRLRKKEIAGYGHLFVIKKLQVMDPQWDRVLMAYLHKRRLQVMDLFIVLINEGPSELCLINQNSEEVHTLQSPNKKKLVLLSVNGILSISSWKSAKRKRKKSMKKNNSQLNSHWFLMIFHY